VRADPVPQPPRPGRPGVGVVAGAQHRHKHIRFPGFSREPVDDRHGLAGMIDEHLLAGAMVLTENQIQAFRPLAVEFAETAVAVPVRMLLLVLLPEQLQRHIRTFQLLVNDGVIGLRPLSRRWRRGRWK
jgi:hypothetical protein